MQVRWQRVVAGAFASLAAAGAASAVPAGAQSGPPTATGRGGAAATLDRTATREAIRALRRGASAVDAAVVAAGVLGVTEPFSCGIGGGGFMVIYRARSGNVTTIDGREESPAAFGPRVFLDDSGRPIPFDEAVYSGLSAGVPGTVATWRKALKRHGTWSLRRALRPGIRVARRGFTVDEPFHEDIAQNQAAFADFRTTRALYLDGAGQPLAVGTRFRNPALARTYRRIADRGPRGFYRGRVAKAIVDTVRNPPVTAGATRNVRPGRMTRADLRAYRAIVRRPTKVGYRGYDVYGMAPPSSGGSTVGEALNILEGYDLASMSRTDALHRYIEASKLAFADRGAYLGDPEFVDVPLRGLLSDAFAAERRELIGERALPTPQPAGDPYDEQGDPSPSGPPPPASAAVKRDGQTTHLTVADRHGNVVAYTFTIEQIGGNGMVVPRWGFLLNNELTDFNFVPPAANAPEPRKRPRSSMSPTIVLRDGKPVLALGAPGGSAIITAVLQVMVERLDLGKSLGDAIESPRVASRNFSPNSAEQAFIESPEGRALAARRHQFAPSQAVGLVNGLEFLKDGRVLAAAEATRGGGGSAGVERP